MCCAHNMTTSYDNWARATRTYYTHFIVCTPTNEQVTLHGWKLNKPAAMWTHLWNTRTFSCGTRSRQTVLKYLSLTGCNSLSPIPTSSMYMLCTSLFMPIGRCTSALSGFGSVYVSIKPWSNLQLHGKQAHTQKFLLNYVTTLPRQCVRGCLCI